MWRWALLLGIVFVLPIASAVLAVTHSPAWLIAFILLELMFAKSQVTTAAGWGALYYNRKGLRELEAGDAPGAARAFERALRFGRGSAAYVNNLALALVYTGELGRSREIIAPIVEGKKLEEPMRAVLMSTWALLLALLGEVEAARAAEEQSSYEGREFSVAAWVIAARERRWPFTRPKEIKGAWASHLYDVLEAYVAGGGYRDTALDRPMPPGLARALAYQWPEMKAFLGS